MGGGIAHILENDQHLELSYSALRTVWNLSSIAIVAMVHTVRSTPFDDVVYCSGCDVEAASYSAPGPRSTPFQKMPLFQGRGQG